MAEKLSGPMTAPQSGEPRQLVVLLHGYGSDGNDLIALGQLWQKVLPQALFAAPNAPSPCDINPAGYQWFPLDLDRDISRLVGSEAARPVIVDFLEDLWAQTGLGPKDTVLVGFSQGAMMALDVGLRIEAPLMGIIAFSGLVIAPETLASEMRSKPPVALFHGEVDDIVPATGSLHAQEFLTEHGVPATVHITPASPHTIAQDALERATKFLYSIAAQQK